LTRIETEGDPRHPIPIFHLDIPSEDGKILREDYDKGVLAVSNIKHFEQMRNFVTATLRYMNKRGDPQWTSKGWQMGRGR